MYRADIIWTTSMKARLRRASLLRYTHDGDSMTATLRRCGIASVAHDGMCVSACLMVFATFMQLLLLYVL